MSATLSSISNPVAGRVSIPAVAFCEVKKRLTEGFLAAMHELTVLQEQQTRAVVEGDPDFSRFDLLLHDAQEQKDRAKYAWISHVESHGCGEA
jgi:hypothetical protein